MSRCALHPLLVASHYCSGCERPLCEECGTRLGCCAACGARVLRIGEEPDDHWVDSLFARALARVQDPITFVTVHAVVPAALIAMVYALYFYVLLLRSLFLSGTGALQWIGFFFVFATVLTARYRKTRDDRTMQAVYTALIWGATGMGLLTRSATTLDVLTSIALLALVWGYATVATYAVSLEGKGETSRRSAAAPIVFLGVLALLIFAIGEPLMLNAEPEVAVQAMVAIIVFLLSAGVSMAAAAATSQARRAYRASGSVALRVIPQRIRAAAAFAFVAVTVALAVPGVRFAGSGRIQLAPEEILQQRRLTMGFDERAGQIGSELIEGLPWGWLSGLESLTTTTGQASVALVVVAILQYTGLLIIAAAAIAAAIYALRQRSAFVRRLAPAFAEALRSVRERVAARLPAWPARRDRRRDRHIDDPFADLEALRRGESREAILEVYLRSTAVLERLGHPRRPATTPHDLLASLPEGLSSLSDPLGQITSLYVRAAYSDQEMLDADRDGAVAGLIDIRDALATIESAAAAAAGP